MKVVQAPDPISYKNFPDYTKVFLAGGISNCKNWQQDVIDCLHILEHTYDLRQLLIINPRRDVIEEGELAAIEQIKWEHKWLEKSDIFSVFFVASDSVQPITLYETGKYTDRKYSVITVEEGYLRELDVVTQTALDGLYCGVYKPEDSVMQHARTIAYTYQKVRSI